MVRFSPGCNCCGVCTYQASDGSEYSNTFSSLGSGWTSRFAVGTWSVSGGRLRYTADEASESEKINGLYRTPTTDIEESGITLIQEVTVYRLSSVTLQSSLWIREMPGVFGTQWSMNVLWADSEIECTTPGGGTDTISQSVSDGDKLTIVFEEIGGSNRRTCFFVNETEIHYIEDTSAMDTNPLHGVGLRVKDDAAPPVGGEFDDYTVEFNRG